MIALLNLLRLNGLPFPPEHFDFVRAVGLDMAIPEDEVCRSYTSVFLPV